MRYLLLTLLFMGVAIVAAAVLSRLGGRGWRVEWRASVMAAAVLVLLTAVFDSLMIASGLFSYTAEHISGITIGLAPIEDFAYPIAIIIALPVFWELLNRRAAVPVRRLLREAFVASRPVSWINTAFPFAAAYFLTTREIDWVLVVGALYYLIPYNLAMYGINDVFDYASDINNPRKGGIEGALLQPQFHRPMLQLAAWSNIPFLLVLAAVGGPASWGPLLVSTFAVIAYSAAGLRFKERPVLDSITSSTHFVSPAVVGLALTGAAWQPSTILLLAAFFLWGMAAHAFGAVQDIQPDRAAGIGSIATVFGARATVWIALVLWTLAGVLMLFTPWPGPLAAAIVIPYLVNCAPWARVTDDTAAGSNRAWRRFIWLNYGAGFIATMIMILWWNS
ncbi:prenyltransferase [Leucobacter insecticola]|uniref:Prenyltransferase n=1 Tax=Leucobacter insecticola TaxID=2714934 RepID=A0A6G8FJM2_9MICO|nr:prenyltransferase [Leucobacter insecticola]QIM16538.1 prenyltransferase [Leucobacter insecticola]